VTPLLEAKLSNSKMMSSNIILIPFFMVLWWMCSDVTYMSTISTAKQFFLKGFAMFTGILIVRNFVRMTQGNVRIRVYKQGILVATISRDIIPWAAVQAISRPDRMGRMFMYGIKVQDWVKLDLKPGVKINERRRYKLSKFLNFPINFDHPHFLISRHVHSPNDIYNAINKAYIASQATHG